MFCFALLCFALLGNVSGDDGGGGKRSFRESREIGRRVNALWSGVEWSGDGVRGGG